MTLAEHGFLITFNFHEPGEKRGPVDTRTPVSLGGTKKAGNGGNKSQAVALKMAKTLPDQKSNKYHLFMDNLFMSTNFAEVLRKEGFGCTGTANLKGSGIIEELAEIKRKDDKKDALPWGTTNSFVTPSNLVSQTGWKDNSYVLTISTVLDSKEQVLRNRKRPKKSSSRAKTSRVPFGDEPTKDLLIPALYDEYNHKMGFVDQQDQLFSYESGRRQVRRGGHQALEHWLLGMVLVNCYLISYYSPKEETKDINFRSQTDFREQIMSGLFELGKSAPISRKRRVSHINPDTALENIREHTLVKMLTPRDCVNFKGLRSVIPVVLQYYYTHPLLDFFWVCTHY